MPRFWIFLFSTISGKDVDSRLRAGKQNKLEWVWCIVLPETKHEFKNPGSSSRIIKEWNQGKETPVSKILMSRSGVVGGMQVSMSYR